MDLRKVVLLRGPNLWAPCPMLEAWVGLAEFQDRPMSDSPAAFQRLAAWLDHLPDPADGQGPDVLRERLARGLSLAEFLPALVLRMQRAGAGSKVVTRSFTQPSAIPGEHVLAVEFEEEALAERALAVAWRMCLAATGDGEFDPAVELGGLRTFADRYCLGPSTRSIVKAARKRHIPAQRLDDGSLIQLGNGIHGRRLFTAETDRASVVSEAVAQDKELTKTLLRAVGVPVPDGRIVSGAEDAWQAACEIGLPVVVKPRDANHGRGVAINLHAREQIESAYAGAVDEGSGVIVERWAHGAEHRLLVVGDRLVAASRGEPEQVVGDGLNTVAALVDLLNQDPRRGLEFACPLGKVELDPPGLLTLQQQGYGPDSVPRAGATVLIHANGDYTTDETDEVHPDVAADAVLAAQVIGLDVAGIDVIAQSIARPLSDQGGVVIEVNAGPGLNMHLAPQIGQPRAVGEAIVESLFPAGARGRVPLVAVCGRQSDALTWSIARLLHAAGNCVGVGDQVGAFVDQRRLEGIAGGVSQRQRQLLLHPRLTAAVFENSAHSILEGGLAFEQCDVAVVGTHTEDVSGDATELARSREPGTLERVLAATVVNDGYLILWAEEPLAGQFVAASNAGKIWLTTDGDHPLLVEARRRGERGVFWRDDAIWFADGERNWPLAGEIQKDAIARVVAHVGLKSLLAVAAVGWALGLAEEVIAGELGGGAQNTSTSAGRDDAGPS